MSRVFHFVISFATLLATCSAFIDTDNYSIWSIPESPTDIVVKNSLPGAALIGGGPDCIPAFQYMISHAAGGDFVILRASGADDYNPFVWELAKASGTPLNSVTTILFKNRNASSDSAVQQILTNAEAIFFAGGDQSLYLKYWRDTPVQSIIQSKLQVDTTIGGTSAGLAILGNWIYSAETGSVYSDDCLENPYNLYVTLQQQLFAVPYLQNLITDTHFSPRDRMGRTLSFMGRIFTDNAGSPVVHGMGVDETTAVLLDIQHGNSTVVGEGNVYLCSSDAPPAVCKSEVPLTFTGIQCRRFSGHKKETFDFASMQGQGVTYINDVVDGRYLPGSQPYGPQ